MASLVSTITKSL
ncbi:hypothetical protein YPPY66_3851, partial [Yersinia pestis PY-66]